MPRLSLSKNLFSLLVCAVMISCTFYSLHFGVPWSDEASHLLPNYKFLVGQFPYIDEYFVNIQSAALFFQPAFELFYFLNHQSIEGIFIFGRYFYTFVAIMGFLLLTQLLRHYLPFYLAALIAINMVSFAPFGLHSPFYDNLMLLCLTLGCFSFARAIEVNFSQPQQALWLWLATGVLFALMTAVYPPMGLSCLSVFIAYQYFSVKKLAYYSVGMTIGVAWLVAITAYIGFEQAIVAVKWNMTEHPSPGFSGGIKPALFWYSQIISHIKIFLVFLLILRALKSKIKPHFSFVCLIITLLGLIGWIVLKLSSPYGHGMGYTAALAILAPFLYLFLSADNSALSLIKYVWLPSFLLWPVIAYVSGSSGFASVIALFPGALVSLVFIVKIFFSFSLKNRLLKKIPPLCSLLILGIIACGYQVANLRYFYGDVPIRQSQYCFTHGALKALCTAKQGGQLVQAMTKKLQPFTDRHQTLNAWKFPLGFFIGSFIPLTDVAYGTPDSAIQYFQQQDEYPDILLELKHFPGYFPPLLVTAAQQEFLKNNYQLHAEEEYFAIYVRH